ncbi:Crp/Fnr family transcriptional regulator [Aquimarina algiphila]|uniref:Crp/Fnr family transcriptional regulator n=1 Tax=Aquimarina algiphila TaxID=2047982 RepID=UPI00232E3058|nr:Crp/Fnr family transcriptional regulator [Aquimarina algiphila]
MCFELFDILIKAEQYKRCFYCQKEIIKTPEYLDKKIYLIKNGIVKISSITEHGEEIILVILTTGEVFGASLIFENPHLNYICESINEETILYEFDMACIQKIIKKNCNINQDFLHIIGTQYFELERRIKILTDSSAEQRLINVLIEFKNKFENLSDNEENIIIHLPINQDELSNYIRTTRVTTNKIINKLKNNFLIEYHQKTITLKKDFFKYYK